MKIAIFVPAVTIIVKFELEDDLLGFIFIS
jgi:hypothetical protein